MPTEPIATPTASDSETSARSSPAVGHVFILSAPSGAGKTTLRRAALERFPDIQYSVSFTTRPPRSGEVDGRDYHFISAAEFEEGIRSGRWAEWAQVHQNYYGTSSEVLEQALATGRIILLDIDVQGARQILRRFPQSITVFIMPPSLEVLEARLRGRGTDAEGAIQIRLRNAIEEMAQRGHYRHVIVNDDLSVASQEIATIIRSYRK
jgi:guanylate kinase